MISILIPVFDTPAFYLKECLDSCINQSFLDYEIVIIDNGSTNKETIAVLNHYKEHEKINLFNCPRQEKKKNLSIALNYGLQKCKFNLVARMDSDDVMLSNRLELQYNYFLKNEEVDIAGGQIKIFPSGALTRHKEIINPSDALSSYWFINHPTVMYKKDKILSIGGYLDEPEMFAEDYELWLRALGEGLIIRNLQHCLVFYRSHGQNLTRQTEKNPNYYDMMNKQKNKLREKIDNS